MRDEATKLNQKRVIIYARYSTDLQNEKSAEDQVFECKQYAERQGWNVVDIIFDEATSGANEQRQGYRKVRRAIEEQACDIILAENIDRLTRDQEHAARLNKEARFYEVEIHTTARGQLDAIQIAFGSTLGQMFLQDIAAKTRRGLSATVRQGKSAGGKSFGYRNQIDERGEKKIGELEIVEEEAAIIRRIFRMYVEGTSPLSIAAQLNKERIPAPRSGKSSDKKGGWRQTTINGNRQRGTGILNNELYIGKRIWNRLEYRKNPHTGKKVSRLNPESEWQIVEVPDLQIVPLELWQAVKARQDAQTKVRASKEPTDRNMLGANQMLRRRKHLLSGLLKCGKCGANLTIAGSVEKRYYCSTAKELGKTQCSGFPGLSSDRASEHVLSVLQTQMLTDEAFQRFQRQYIDRLEQIRQDLNSADKVREKKVKRLEKEKENLLKAVKSGRAQDIIFDELERVAGELERIKAEYEANRPAPIELPKDLHKMYTAYVGNLVDTLRHEGVIGKAAEAVHEMIDHIHVTYDETRKGHTLWLEGDLVELLSKADPSQKLAYERAKSSIELVAGTGFEPVTFRL